MLLNTFIGLVPKLHRAGNSLELVGGPGIGKSASMYQGAANLSRELRGPVGVTTFILSQMDPTDIRGFLFPVKDGDKLMSRFTRPTVFPDKYNTRVYVDGVAQHDYYEKGGGLPSNGVIFFDEFGQAAVDTQKPTSQLILERSIGEEHLPDGWVVWAASNRVKDKSGTVKRLRMLQNRMMQLPIEASMAVWEDWAIRAHIHPLIIRFAVRYPSVVFRDEVPDHDGPFCSPRSLVLLGKQLEALRDPGDDPTKLPIDGPAVEMVAGWIGAGDQAAFTAFVRLADKMPDINQIFKEPKKAPIPTEIDVKYILTMTLVHQQTKKTMPAIIEYLSRPEMDKELQILFVSSCIKRDPTVVASPEFHKWVSANKNLAIAAIG